MHNSTSPQDGFFLLWEGDSLVYNFYKANANIESIYPNCEFYLTEEELQNAVNNINPQKWNGVDEYSRYGFENHYDTYPQFPPPPNSP